MNKAEATAIINAIRESISFLMTNGISIRQNISSPAADATRVEGLLTAYSANIAAIIADIPDDENP